MAPGALGSAHPLTAPYQAFETSDGWITLGASNQSNYERVCPGQKTSAAWLAALDGAGVPAGPVFDIPQMLAYPQTIARGMVVETPA